jgi:hypothetical protein
MFYILKFDYHQMGGTDKILLVSGVFHSLNIIQLPKIWKK